MKIKSLGFILGLALAASVSQASANIVNDPGFELNNGSWTENGFTVGNNGYANTGSNTASTGCVGHACMDQNNGAYIQQTLSTATNQTYNLSFYVGEIGGPTSEMAVYWNGALIADILDPANNTNPGPFIQYSFNNLLATGGSTVLQVNGRQDPGAIFFDDFSVNAASAVPEPSTWAMMILGFAGVGFMAYRRRNSAMIAA